MMALDEATVRTHFENFATIWISSIDQGVGILSCHLSSAAGNSIAFQWESRAPEEIWYSLGTNGKWIYEGWDEHLEHEPPEVLLEYTNLLAKRWLDHKVRVKRRFWLWGHVEPQFLSGSGWANIRSV